MNLPVKHPFEGSPLTIQNVDAKGRPVMAVKARALTPLRAKFADFLSFAGVLGLITGSLYPGRR
jgi:hypothetical protein